jgi:hypothetical protein
MGGISLIVSVSEDGRWPAVLLRCLLDENDGWRAVVHAVRGARTPTTITRTAFIAETLPPKGFTSRQKVSLPAKRFHFPPHPPTFPAKNMNLIFLPK